MITAWTKNIKDPVEKDRFVLSIQGSKPILDRLKELLKEDEIGLDRSETDIKTFDTPGWDYKQAYKNGYRKCLQMTNELIDLDQQKDNSK